MGLPQLPIPFTITIYGIGYDKGEDKGEDTRLVKGLFRKDLLINAIEKTIEEHVIDGTEVKYTIETHSFQFDMDKVKETY